MRVKGTMPEVIPLEVNIDTVYVRSNIVRIETEDFDGWEYDEEQFPIVDFIASLRIENVNLRADLNNAVMELSMLIAMGGSI